MKHIILAAALLAAFGAHATGKPPSPSAGDNTANAGAISASRAEARAKAAAIAAQRQSLNSTITNTVPVKVRVNVTAPAAAPAAVETKVAPTEQPIKQAAAAEKSDQVIVAPAQDRDPVNTAYAAPLIASPETCMGSSSGGVQTAAVGVSVASTWESVKCDRRMNARTLEALGRRAAAIALMCQDADVAKAMQAVGEKCPGAERAAALQDDRHTRAYIAARDSGLLP